MASIHLQGILVDSVGEIDVGGVITFTHLTTTGETIASTQTELIIPPDGAYSIDVEYGQIRIDYTTRNTERFVANVIVNSASTATSLPELLSATTPVAKPIIIQMQGLVADAVTAEAGAVAAAATTATRKDTFANLIALSPTTDGSTFVCQERASAEYILKPSGYSALAGDATFANGRVAQLQERDRVEYFSDIYSAVSGVGVTIEGDYLQDLTTSISMNGDALQNFNYVLDVADATTTLSFTPFSGGASFTSSFFDGGTTEAVGVRNRTAHMVNLSGTAVNGLTIKDSEITGFTFPILKSNTSVGTQERFSITNNYFHDNYGVDALFNSPATGSLLKNIIVNGNMFGSNLAEDIGGFSHRISMAGYVDNFVVTGNCAFGQGNEFWRSEERARNGVIVGNAAKIGDRHGIETTDNNVGGVAYTPSQLIISSNALEGKGLAGTRGLHFAFDGSGVHPIEKSICGGNILSNWETGVRLARKASLNDNTGNVINDCVIGVLAQEPTLTLDNTTMVDVTTKLDADSGGLFGKIHLRDTTSDTPLFTNMVAAAGNPAAITGWTYESQLFSTAATANNYIPVIELGDSFHLDVKIYFGREAGNFSFVRGIIEYDGTTLVFTQSHRNQSGSLVLSGAPFRANAGNLEVSIFAGAPAIYSNCRIQISTEGLHVFA
tara:strand:+ start:382 stop:2382 length:2001 start_codon:yes stop_codon:yes gene_type:complete